MKLLKHNALQKRNLFKIEQMLSSIRTREDLKDLEELADLQSKVN